MRERCCSTGYGKNKINSCLSKVQYFEVKIVIMKKADVLKKLVRDKYAGIAVDSNKKCCCSKNTSPEYSVFTESYAEQQGYVEDADLGLGCGLPTEYAGIKEGDAVLDLGCGAGNDCFIARRLVGESGKVTGLDFTGEMLEKAQMNNQKMGYSNVGFIKGDIEHIPLPDNSYDVVISNCVLNLVPDKKQAFSEILRTLKKGGHFCVSDIVLMGELPDNIRNAAALYAGCVSGALLKEAYINTIQNAGFSDIEIKKERQIIVPDEMLLEYISKEELETYQHTGAGIFSITVVGSKP
jgi:SAM-dependent methyltransferase